MLTSETKRRLQSCRDLLVGKLPQPAQQVELITLALIYKFMDDLDEESVSLGGKRSFFTGPLAPYRWRALLPQTVSADERVALFSGGLEAIGNAKTSAHLPALFRDIFRNAFLKFRDGRILTLFLNEINGFAYTHSEELGNAFEFLLQSSGAQGENGQFRTPRHIIDFIVACLDPKPTDKILDPACGTGGFLVSSYKHILAKHTSPGSTVPGDRLGRDQLNRVYHNLTGYDTDDHMVQLSKVNLFLHGFPDPAIHIYDTLSNDARWSEKADLILANPPFMTPKGGVTPHTRFRIPAKKAEVLFTDYIAEHLTPDGRAGIIVPNGIVATTQNAYVKLRRFLVEDSLVAVVSLPSGVFKPYSGVKTSILFLDKKLARQTQEILFLKISADGFDLGDQRREIEADDLPLAKRYLDRWLKGQLGDEPPMDIPFNRVDKRELLATKDCTLVAERFLGIVETTTGEHPMVRLGDESVFKLESGSTPSTEKPEYWGGRHAWATLADLPAEDFVTRLTRTERTITDAGLKNSSAVILPVGSILVSSRATLGRVALAQLPVATNQGFKNIVIKDPTRALPEYVAIAVTQLKDQMLAFASGGTFKEISKSNFAQLEIPLPPLEEQRRIVTEIEGYQQVIDGARQILTAYRPLIEISADWDTPALGEILHFMRNGCDVEQKDEPAKFRVSRIQSIADGTFNAEKTKWTNDEVAEDRLLKHGDILLSHINSEPHLAKTAIFRGCNEPVIHGINLLLLRANREIVNPDFLAYWLKQSAFIAKARTYAKRAVNQASITTSDLKSIPIPLPPLPEQERIVTELDAEAARMEAVRGLIPAFEAKIARTLARVWGTPPTP